MDLELQTIDFEKYAQEREDVLTLARLIWTRPESSDNVVHSIERWVNDRESGNYFYIMQNGEKIGITGYWVIKAHERSFGLRHHGITIKGTGKKALDILINHLQSTYGQSVKHLVEFIPEGREELIGIFEKWGFELDSRGVSHWEPKKEYTSYYKYAMVKTI